MNNYVTGAAIRRLREEKGLTQEELANRLSVSGKAVSKWETGQGFPDVSLLEPIAGALGISVIELISGEDIRNRNRAFNMAKCRFYVCPVCGNVITSAGETLISCCGVTLPPLEPEAPEGEHRISVEVVEDEYYVTLAHPMEREHYVSFLAAVTDNGVGIVKLYPEGGCEARFKTSRVQRLFAYCNRHGLFSIEI